MLRALAPRLGDCWARTSKRGTCRRRSCLGHPVRISPYSPCAGPETRPPGRLFFFPGFTGHLRRSCL